MPATPKAAPKAASFLNVGDLIHLVTGGRTYQNYEVLGMDDRFLKLRANIQNAPQTDIILVPYEKIETLGLPNEH